MLSIIIPVLNESENITALLTHLVENSRAQHISEIIVVDGGSTDTTCQLTTNFTENATVSVQLFSSERGRAKQMNLGAKQAKGDILYFLHADRILRKISIPLSFPKYKKITLRVVSE